MKNAGCCVHGGSLTEKKKSIHSDHLTNNRGLRFEGGSEGDATRLQNILRYLFACYACLHKHPAQRDYETYLAYIKPRWNALREGFLAQTDQNETKPPP